MYEKQSKQRLHPNTVHVNDNVKKQKKGEGEGGGRPAPKGNGWAESSRAVIVCVYGESDLMQFTASMPDAQRQYPVP